MRDRIQAKKKEESEGDDDASGDEEKTPGKKKVAKKKDDVDEENGAEVVQLPALLGLSDHGSKMRDPREHGADGLAMDRERGAQPRKTVQVSRARLTSHDRLELR